jgi:hypothetical protein
MKGRFRSSRSLDAISILFETSLSDFEESTLVAAHKTFYKSLLRQTLNGIA